jgi:hypothetical protein
MPDIKLPDHTFLQFSRSQIKSSYLSAIIDFFSASVASTLCTNSSLLKTKTSRVIMYK